MAWSPWIETRSTFQSTRQERKSFASWGEVPDDLIGVSVWDAFPDVRGTVVEREIKRSLESGVRIEYEFLYPPNQHLYQVQGYPSPEGVILVFRDLTSRENR